MTQELIKPNQQIAPHFVAAIISFLRSSFGEKEYNDLRIGDPTKKIGADYSSVQFSSLSPDKEITSLWDFLKQNDAGLEVKNITPGGSDEKVTAIKISLDLPKEFLVKYGNGHVTDFCEESDDSNDQNDSNDTSDLGRVGSQPNSLEGEEDEGIIKTVEELVEAVADVSDPRAKSRTVSSFFKWFLEQNGITEYEVVARTGYKYRGNEPEFAVRILNTEEILKVLEEFRSQGCDVDIAGREKNVVRVKALVFDPDIHNTNEPQRNRQQSSGPKKSTKKTGNSEVGKRGRRPKKKNTPRVSKEIKKTVLQAKPKSASKAPALQQKLFTDVFMEDFSQLVRDFLKKPTEGNFRKFREVVTLKQKELEILKDIQTSFLNLLKLREKSKF
jgi:hypothetical protein